MNIIVPNSKKGLEKDIKNTFLDYFYFQKVEVANIYNKALDLPAVALSKEDLSVNIIYAENNQDYFPMIVILGILGLEISRIQLRLYIREILTHLVLALM